MTQNNTVGVQFIILIVTCTLLLYYMVLYGHSGVLETDKTHALIVLLSNHVLNNTLYVVNNRAFADFLPLHKAWYDFQVYSGIL